VSTACISIVAGAKSSQKSVLVEGVDRERAGELLGK
jgi:uncharacterized protein YggU (UPF0235/DUF167 family)